jgi:NAD(P)H-nitrite reductase large subunit
MGLTRQVIVGNSAAGLSAVKAIREVDDSCPITLISMENCNSYSPVLLTYYLKGKIPREDLFVVGPYFYEVNRVETMLGYEVTGLNPSRQVVHLKNGEEVEYDNLLIATGASPVSLEHSADTIDHLFYLRTIEDAERILAQAKNANRVIVIGAGLIGLQVAEAIFREGLQLTIIEWVNHILPQIADLTCASFIQKEVERRGITLYLERKVNRIVKAEDQVRVVTDSNEQLTADMVVIATGVRPNTEIFEGSGIKINRGILVDETMRTNISHIFAAGDVCEAKNLITGMSEVVPIWINACRQGRIAGLNMAGCDERFTGGLAENVTTIFGLIVASVGVSETPSGDGLKEIQFFNHARRIYRKMVLANNKIVGAVLMGDTEDAGILGSFIKSRKDVSACQEKLARSSFETKKLLLSLGRQ